MSVWGYFWLFTCENCHNDWTGCAEKLCYEQSYKGTHTDNFNYNAWQECISTYSTQLASICRYFKENGLD